jgi:hypothetical protein
LFHKIDAVLSKPALDALGGTTRRQWSHPEYFFEEWIRQEQARHEVGPRA